MGSARRGDEHHDACCEIGRLVRHWRRVRGLTQEALANKVGCRFQQIQKYECGFNSMTAVQLATIALALEVPIQNFIPATLRLQSSKHDADVRA